MVGSTTHFIAVVGVQQTSLLPLSCSVAEATSFEPMEDRVRFGVWDFNLGLGR